MIFDKTFINIPADYFNYSNIFSIDYIAKLLDYTKINGYAIEREKSKQPSFSPIDSLNSIAPKTLKTYIEINLGIGFI